MRLQKRFFIRFAWLQAGVLLVGCSGGSDSKLGLNPVQGTVVRNGTGLAGCEVAFYPVDPQMLNSGVPVPKGNTDESGQFRLRTFEPGDGARAGQYAVTVRQVETIETPGGQIEERDLLQGAFADRSKPAAQVTINSGSNDLDPIVLD